MIFKLASPFLLATAFFRTIWAKFAGYEVLAPYGVEDYRLETCIGCSFLTEDGQCRVCTCFVDFKVKLAMEQCPKKKWLRVWVKKVKN